MKRPDRLSFTLHLELSLANNVVHGRPYVENMYVKTSRTYELGTL